MFDPPGVYGLVETLEALREFPRATGRNVLRRSLVTAAEPVAALARVLAPDDPATSIDLKSSIGVATQLTRRHRVAVKQNEVEVYVGPTRIAGRAVLNYASFQEFGTVHTPAHPYLRPAFDVTKALVLQILARELTVQYEAAAARINRKYFRTLR